MIEKSFTVKLKQYYVYIHRRKSDGVVFYIGKGKLYRWRSLHRSRYWKSVAEKHGVCCEIVGNSLTNSEAILLERKLIEFYGRADSGGSLVNLTDGGEGMDGYKHSSVSKEKISHTHKYKTVSESSRKKISDSSKLRKRTVQELEQLAQARKLLERPVQCLETGTIYCSAKEAARDISGDHSCIIKVCLGKRKSHKNLTWRYTTLGIITVLPTI